MSDSHKRETYNAIGERGLKWLEEPFSVDPQEMAQNFAHSSTLDRSKIFGIFVAIAIIIFLLPILICLRVDGHMGHDARWIAVLTPLWIFNAVVLFYHFRVIRMGPINKPEDIPDNEWIDPLPMSKRYFSLFRFGLLCIFEVLAALRMDRIVRCVWAVVFIPIFVHEATTMYKKLPLARMKIVTVEDLETALGKQFSDFTSVEKELIARKYSVVPSSDSPEFETAHRLKARGRQDLIKVIVRLILVIIIITQLDDGIHWNWWLIFTPIWIMSFFMCALSFYKFNEAQNAIIRRDPQMFANMTGRAVDEEAASDEHAAANGGASSYGALEENDTGKQSAGAAEKRPELSDHEKEELKAQFLQAGYKLLGSCCSQAFLLLIVCLFVGKLEGAGYSAVWILSPFLFMVRLFNYSSRSQFILIVHIILKIFTVCLCADWYSSLLPRWYNFLHNGHSR